jgi:hypothetical protein
MESGVTRTSTGLRQVQGSSRNRSSATREGSSRPRNTNGGNTQSKDTISHNIGRWGHWGHQRLHGHSKHTLFSGERGMQTKPCLIGAPVVAWLQSNTRSSQERIVEDKILSDSDRREGQKPGRNTAVTGFCPYTK